MKLKFITYSIGRERKIAKISISDTFNDANCGQGYLK